MMNATLTSLLRGRCPAPFFDMASFGPGGYVDGRFCAPIQQIQAGLVCCLPCPATDYIYPAEIKVWYHAEEALNILGLACLVFLAASFICLPAEKTRRHYLSYCLIVGVLFLTLGFVVPLATRPPKCYNEITPNDMFSNLTCAFSGAFIIAGGVSLAVWIFIRALSMHLQIVWDYMPGNVFFYLSQALGWSVIAGLFTATITMTGVSFRFGDVCHVNATNSLQDLWIPLLVIAGGATVIQMVTFTYCIKVYIQHMWSDDMETQSSRGLPYYTPNAQTLSARQVYRRVSKVVWLHWRGIAIVIFILVDVIFLCIVFIYLDDASLHATDDLKKATPFLSCLQAHPIDHEVCASHGQALFVNQHAINGVLIMLSLAGVQSFLLLARGEMFGAWLQLFRSKFGTKREFISLDAKEPSALALDTRDIELNKLPLPLQSPESSTTSPKVENKLHDWAFTDKSESYSKEAERIYIPPPLSFSTLRIPPQATVGGECDPRTRQASGRLGLCPPISENDEGNSGNLSARNDACIILGNAT